MSLYTMKLSDSVDTMEFNLLEVPIQDKDIEGAVDNVVLSGDVYTDFLWLKKRFTHKWSILCKDDYERLRGFYTRQFSNAEVPIYQLLDAPSPIEESAGSGEYIQITTTDSTAKLASVEMLGKAEQTTYSGKNLADLVPMTNGTITNSSYISTLENVYDSTLRKNVVHMVASGTYPTALYTLPQRLESGKYYSLTITYRSSWAGTSDWAGYKEMWVAPNWSTNNWDTLGTFNNDNSKNQTGVSGAKWQHSTSWATATMRFYVDPTQYSSVSASYTKICLSMGYGVNSQTTAKELWIADAMLAEITQAEWDATNYTDEDYEPYVGGTPAPNPSFPQAISVVTGENVVKIEGKNLFNKNNIVNLAPTTTIAQNANYRGFYIKATAGDTYTLSRASTSAPQRFRVVFTEVEPANGVDFYDVNGNRGNIPNTDSQTAITFAVPNGMNYIFLYLANNGSTISEADNIQLEAGSTRTTYEPYHWQEFKIYLPPDTLDYMIEQGGFTVQGLNTVEQNRIRTKYYIPVEPNTQYTMSVASWNTSIGDGTPNFSVSYYSTDDYVTPRLSNKDWTAFSSSATFTTPADCHFVRVLFNIGGYLPITPADMTGIKIRGGNLTPIELAKIGNYQDRIYKDSGKWYIEKQVGKVVLDGSESWTGLEVLTNTTGAYTLYNGILQGTPCLSNYFVERQDYEEDAVGIVCRPYNTSLISLRFSPSTLSAQTIAGIKTWLASNPTIVYYALATPTTTEITNEALITQLDALESASLYLGLNNIGTETQNAVPTLALTYFPYYPHEIISPKAVRMELTDGGIINACECRENVQITLRETIQ